MADSTDSMKDYIRAIYELSSDGEGVRICDIATKRNVTKSSACVAMKILQKQGFVQRDAERLVLLTSMGKEHAMTIINKSIIIRRFLTNALKISRENAAHDVSVMEHSISMETLCSFCRWNDNKHPHLDCKGGCHFDLYD